MKGRKKENSDVMVQLLLVHKFVEIQSGEHKMLQSQLWQKALVSYKNYYIIFYA